MSAQGPSLKKRNGTPTQGRRFRYTPFVLAAFVLLTAGCVNLRTGDARIAGINFKVVAFPGSGAHAVEIFTEMHFAPSFRSQEGPRLLPPPDSVPITGRELRYADLEEYRAVPIPESALSTYDETRATELYRVNCLMCHGAALDGNGPTGAIMRARRAGPFPADLTLPLTQELPEGEVFAYISNGGRQGYAFTQAGSQSRSPMPEFRLLLSEEDRWALVKYLLDR